MVVVDRKEMAPAEAREEMVYRYAHTLPILSLICLFLELYSFVLEGAWQGRVPSRVQMIEAYTAKEFAKLDSIFSIFSIYTASEARNHLRSL